MYLTKPATNSSRTASSTRNRVGEMQTWPALRNLAPAIILIACAMLASAATITGA